jgi:hypothetical protein
MNVGIFVNPMKAPIGEIEPRLLYTVHLGVHKVAIERASNCEMSGIEPLKSQSRIPEEILSKGCPLWLADLTDFKSLLPGVQVHGESAGRIAHVLECDSEIIKDHSPPSVSVSDEGSPALSIQLEFIDIPDAAKRRLAGPLMHPKHCSGDGHEEQSSECGSVSIPCCCAESRVNLGRLHGTIPYKKV